MSAIPVAGSTFTFDVSVVSQSNTNIFQANPTIAAGDFKRSINGGAMTNLDNLPTVAPASSRNIRIVISAAETTSAGAGGDIQVIGTDALGDEWCDISIGLRVAEADVGVLTAAALTAVNAQVVDTLATDTYAEPGQGAPAATTTLAEKIGYLYKAFRNKITQTATTLTVFADDGTTSDQKATVSDDGTTFTRGEIGTGA